MQDAHDEYIAICLGIENYVALVRKTTVTRLYIFCRVANFRISGK